MEFIIGSLNQAKVEATKQVVREYFPHAKVRGIFSSSGVSEQPIGDIETMTGAINRAKEARKEGAHVIGIGLEGGVRKIGDTLYVCNWGALEIAEGHTITAGGAQIPLPPAVSREIEKGRELGPIIDEYFNESQLRQKEGAIGMFTAGTITRVALFKHLLQLLMGQYIYYLTENQEIERK